MSTHIRTRADPQPRTETRPTETEADDGDSTNDTGVTDAAEVSDASDAADDTDSWTNRCQRQFSATDTRRLRNLADEANGSMPNPE